MDGVEGEEEKCVGWIKLRGGVRPLAEPGWRLRFNLAVYD